MQKQMSGRARKALIAIPVILILLMVTTLTSAQVSAPIVVAPTVGPIDKAKSVMVIALNGTVPFGTDSVIFNQGQVEIGSTLSRDADPTVPPQLIIDIRFL